MAVVALYDANVLYPSTLRDVLIRVGRAHLVRPKWSELILDETFRNLQANRPDLGEDRLRRTRALMNRALRDVLVTGHEHLIEALDLPDPDDRHVLAAAITAEAKVAEHPDNFLASLVTEHPSVLGGVAEAIAGTWADADVEMVLKSLAVEAPRSAALISEELKAV
jgi:hypothetical protein